MKIPKYDKSKCQAKQFKGYTGCMCEYCLWYLTLLGDWKVNVKEPAFRGEISIIRENNRHGFASCGWDHPNRKVILFSDYHRMLGNFNNNELKNKAWNELIKMAHRYAKLLNKQDKMEQSR